MKLSTATLKDKKGNTVEVEQLLYDGKGNIERRNYYDGNNNLKYYKAYEYNDHGNCIKETDFSADGKFQGSEEHHYNDKGVNLKTIIRTVDGSIYEWYENFELPSQNLKVWIAKDTDGKIIHKTEENLTDHSQRRFNDEGKLYELYQQKYDAQNRLIEEIITDENGKEKRRNLYSYNGQSEIWTLIDKGEFIKIEENVYDNHRNWLYNIRKDNNGKSLEWCRFTYDDFGNKTKYFWGKDEGVEIGYKTFELTYLQNTN